MSQHDQIDRTDCNIRQSTLNGLAQTTNRRMDIILQGIDGDTIIHQLAVICDWIAFEKVSLPNSICHLLLVERACLEASESKEGKSKDEATEVGILAELLERPSALRMSNTEQTPSVLHHCQRNEERGILPRPGKRNCMC